MPQKREPRRLNAVPSDPQAAGLIIPNGTKLRKPAGVVFRSLIPSLCSKSGITPQVAKGFAIAFIQGLGTPEEPYRCIHGH